MLSKREMAKRTASLVMGSGSAVCLCGSTGVGKTDMITQLGEEFGKKVIILNSAIQSTEDLIGYPYREGDVMRWAKPEWFPEETESGCILFIDEINRAEKQVINALMPMLLNGELHSHKLPKGTWVATAINPDTEDYDMVNGFEDKAIWSRLCIIEVKPDFDEWKKWLIQNGKYEKRIVDKMKEMLRKTEMDLPENTQTPNNRSCTKCLDVLHYAADYNKSFGDIYYTQDVVNNAFRGICGFDFALEMANMVTEFIISGLEGEKSWESVLKEASVGNILQIKDEIIAKLSYDDLHEKDAKVFVEWCFKYSEAFGDQVKEIIRSIPSSGEFATAVLIDPNFSKVIERVNAYKG